MTPACIKAVYALQSQSEAFNEMTVEQLLLAAIIGSDLEDVFTTLSHTDWKKWCPNEDKYKGNNPDQKLISITVEGEKSARTIDLKGLDFEHKVRMLLAYI